MGRKFLPLTGIDTRTSIPWPSLYWLNFPGPLETCVRLRSEGPASLVISAANRASVLQYRTSSGKGVRRRCVVNGRRAWQGHLPLSFIVCWPCARSAYSWPSRMHHTPEILETLSMLTNLVMYTLYCWKVKLAFTFMRWRENVLSLILSNIKWIKIRMTSVLSEIPRGNMERVREISVTVTMCQRGVPHYRRQNFVPCIILFRNMVLPLKRNQ
jgi:hypothetical protein